MMDARRSAKLFAVKHLSSVQRFSYSFILASVLVAGGCALKSGSRTIPPEVEAVIGTVSDDIEAGRYEKIYQEAADLWRQDVTLEDSIATFKRLRTKLGDFESRTLQSAAEQENAGGPLKGRAFIVLYRSKFKLGEGMETFTIVERNGKWQLARYFVNSTQLQ